MLKTAVVSAVIRRVHKKLPNIDAPTLLRHVGGTFSSQNYNRINYELQDTIYRQFSTTTKLGNEQFDGKKAFFQYGKADFELLRASNKFFVDKTELIPKLEDAGDQLFCVRPPRWGKSMLISMLSSYYDLNKTDQFEQLFGDLWIAKPENHTPMKNQYHVLNFDLSFQVDGTAEVINEVLHTRINDAITAFLETYNLVDQVKINATNAFSSFDRLVYCLKRRRAKLMVFIDEYDRFANKLMFDDPQQYKLIIAGERGNVTSSPIRSFFERLNWASSIGLADFRSFTLGVTPIALADASGYNVAIDISQDPAFADLVGFTEDDLRRALTSINIIGKDQDTAISVMWKYYNGYRFPGSKKPLFNPTVSLHFLRSMLVPHLRSRVMAGTITIRNLHDVTVEISDTVFKTLTTSIISNKIVEQLLANDKIAVVNAIRQSFKLREIIDPPCDKEDENRIYDNTLSFMYYHGMITFSERASNELTLDELIIPNEISKVQYIDQLKRLVALHDTDFLQLYEVPDEYRLKNVLTSIVTSCKPEMYDNYFSENTLRHKIYCVIQTYLKNNIQLPQFTIDEEFHVGENDDPDYESRCDLKLECDKYILIIELKRVRLNAINYKWSSVNINPNWGLESSRRNASEELNLLNEAGLMKLPLKKEYYELITDVACLVKSAKEQVSKHVDLMKLKLKHEKPVLGFVAIQVGYPLIVQQAKD